MQTLKGFDAVYCDASFFIALFSKKDAKHKRALELFKEIKKNRIIIHTCWFIISEAMTVLLYRYGYSEALTFNQSIDLTTKPLGCSTFFGTDRKISFVDTLSRVIISGELKGIPAVSFDKDFKSLGLTTIS